MRLFVIFCSVFLIALGTKAQSLEKKCIKVEKLYLNGDVKKAFVLNTSIIKKLSKSVDSVNAIQYRAYLNQAILDEALNKYDKVQSHLLTGIEALNRIALTNREEYLNGLKVLSDFYYQNGDYYLADSTAKKALSYLISADSSFGSSKYSLKLIQLKTFLKLGLYNEAYQIEQNTLTNAAKTVNKLLNNGKANLKTKDSVYSKKSFKSMKLEYSNLLNLKAEILFNKGNYKELDAELQKNEKWMRLNIGRRNLRFRDHLYLKSKFAENKNDLLGALKLYEQVNHYTQYKPVEKTGLAVQEKLVLLNHQVKRQAEGHKYNKKLEKSVKRYFGTKSPIMARYHFLDINKYYLDYKYNKANKRLDNLFTESSFIKDNKTLRLALLDMKVKLLVKSCQFEEAEDSLKVILSLKGKMYGLTSPEYHKEKLRLADFYSNFTNKFIAAKDIQENSFLTIVAPQLSTQHISYTDYMEQLASTYDNMEKYDMAIKYLDEASKYLKSYYGKDNIEYAVSLEKLSSILIKKGVYGDAENLIKQAVSIFKNVSGQGYEVNKSAAYLAMARLFTLLGSYNEAEIALKKAGKYSKKANKSENLSSVNSVDEMADLLIKKGRYNEAERLLKSTIDKKQKQLGESNRDLIPSLNLLSRIYLITGDYVDAEKNIQRSIKLTEKNFSDSSVRYTESLKLLEKLYRELGDFKKSEEVSRSTLKIQRKQLGNNHIEVANSLTQLALIDLHNNPTSKEPEQMMLEALAITKFNFGTQHPQYAEQLKELALVCIHDGKYSIADSLLIDAEKIWKFKHSKADVFTAELAVLRGNVFYKRGNYLQAQEKYLEAKRLFKTAFNQSHPGYVKTSSKLARAYFMINDYKNALKELDESTTNYLNFIKKYFPSLSFSEKTKYWNSIKDDFEFYYTLGTKAEVQKPEVTAKMYTNIIATKALLLGSSIKVKERIVNSKDENLIAKFDLWTEKKQYLLQATSMDNEQQKEANVNLVKLEKEINQLEKELSEGSELFLQNFDKQSISWKNVKKALKKDEYAVEMLRFRYFNKNFTDSIIYAALVLSTKDDKGPQMVVLGDGNNLEERYIRYYRNAIINKSDEDEFSFTAFWQPIKSIITDGSKVFFSNEGVYNELNLESIRNFDRTFVIDKNVIAVVSNTKDIIKKSNKKAVAVKKAVFFGNPTFYADASNTELQLLGTDKEVSESQSIFTDRGWNTQKYTERTADEDSLKMVKNPRILHIATHGYFRKDIEDTLKRDEFESEFIENPLLKSGVLMQGAGEVLKSGNLLKINSEKGILTAYEAMDMSLDNTDLVVLSACETGRGQVNIGEGVFGLQRAFLVAGANSLIMSLFKVDDQITKELMTSFYKLWLTSGDKRQALTEAKLLIKAKYKYPIYWGSFVLVGVDD